VPIPLLVAAPLLGGFAIAVYDVTRSATKCDLLSAIPEHELTNRLHPLGHGFPQFQGRMNSLIGFILRDTRGC
jgi:hypothetical protein